MEQNTVGHIDLHCRSIHDHRSMLQINMEEGHRITFMVQRHQKLIVREELCILGILTADRQTAQHVQKAGFLITAVDGYALISRIAAEHMLLIRREA